MSLVGTGCVYILNTYRLDKLGFPVFASCLTEDGCRSLSEVCSSRLVTLTLNVADTSIIARAYEVVKQKLPRDNCLWAVVNNAGVPGTLTTVEMLTQADYLSNLAVNLLGPVEMSSLFAVAEKI
uniref:Ketoreductase (KR) domain-containing protein n=1 Tax=Arion vulgaris TaxID=1028688 RepID=A0A0B7BM18_9EUPU